jgi:hypothetical protein
MCRIPSAVTMLEILPIEDSLEECECEDFGDRGVDRVSSNGAQFHASTSASGRQKDGPLRDRPGLYRWMRQSPSSNQSSGS